MVKRIGRRFVSLLLTFVTILTMLPAMTLPALAATGGGLSLPDSSIGLSYSGDAESPWEVKGTTITGSAKSISGEGCDSGKAIPKTSTLTITNNKTTPATLSFDYDVTVNSGTIQVDGTGVSASGKFSKELAAGGTVTVYIKSNSNNTTDATTITMTNISLVADLTATVAFLPAENGSYTVDGKPFTEKYTNTQSAATAYKLVATPNKGYKFLGWYNVTSQRYINPNATASLKFDSDCTITARFASNTAALFETGGWLFDDLDEAGTYAQANSQDKKITLASDGKITRKYTIPSGVTLLIPFDEHKTVYEETPATTRSATTATPFRTLTMASGSSITLARGAAISVGGQYFASQGGQSGKMVGPYGYIKMESGSAITVQGGASLYAWGFISGSGSVTVESGGTVYEWYQILDFRGGFATVSIVTAFPRKEVFPLSQYTVQNVEVPLTLCAGASETVYTAVYAEGSTYPTPIQFIGNNGMFRLISGSLTKTYDVGTDRLIYTINGDAEVNSLSLKLAETELDSSKYVLPFTNNMTVVLKSGNKLTMNQTAALLPSVSVTIEKNAELVVPKNQSMYIYDVDQWGNYCFSSNGYVKSVSVPYTPGKPGKRAPLTDAKVDINGTLTAIGSVYTTDSGADICSSEGGGRFVQQNAPGQEKTTYQVTKQASSKSPITDYAKIPITPAKLKNNGNSYIETKDAVANDTFTYCKCTAHNGGTWVPNLMVAEFNATQYGTLKEAADAAKGASYVRLLHSTTEDITAQNDLYLDLNGYTVTGYFDMDGHILYGMDSTTDGYDGRTAGKIVGGASFYKNIYQTGNMGDDTYKRYVAIQGKEADKETANLSFHRFNISVTGYRFELEAPECALIFCGKFQGDKAAKDYLKSLGFTLTGKNGPELKSCEMPEALVDKFVEEDGDAYLFELYLKRSFEKNPPDNAAYTEEFSATAQATFKNSGVSEDNSLLSDKRNLSFKEAWQNALSDSDMDEKHKEILNKFITEYGINIQTE